MLGPKDDFKFNLVEEKDNYTIKLQRSVGYGEFQVWYMGRPIMYYKNVNYEISFAYRILQGSEKPFNVGWWVDDGQGYINNLPQVITPIDSVWKKCKVSYKFNKDYINPTCFLNSLQAGSTIEVKDISLTCDDTTGLPMYADQLPDSVIHSFFAKEGTDTINYFTSPAPIAGATPLNFGRHAMIPSKRFSARDSNTLSGMAINSMVIPNVTIFRTIQSSRHSYIRVLLAGWYISSS